MRLKGKWFLATSAALRYFDEARTTDCHANGAEGACLNRFLRTMVKYYPYFAVSLGILSIFFSIIALLTKAGLQYHFAYFSGRINLTLGDPFVNTVVWIIFLLGFCAYPLVVKEARSSRPVVLSHGVILLFIVSLPVWPEMSPLLALANIAAFLIAFREYPRRLSIPRGQVIALSLATLFSFGILVELLALYAWSTSPFAALRAYSTAKGALFSLARLDLGFFFVAYSLVVWLILLLMASPVIIEAILLLKRRATLAYPLSMPDMRLRTAYVVLGLVCTCALSAIVAALPYSLSSYPVGIDVHWYYGVLNALTTGAPLSILGDGWKAHMELHIVFVMLAYSIQSAAQLSAREAVMSAAMVTSTLFALGSFLIAREAGTGDLGSLAAGFFAGVSPQALVGTLASIFGSWLAMAEMMFFFALLLRAVKTRSKRSLVVSLAAALLVMVTHPWTYPILLLILTVYVVLSALQNRSWEFLRRSAGLKILLASVLAGFVAFALAQGSLVFDLVMAVGQTGGLLANVPPWRSPDVFLHDVQVALLNYSTQGFYSNWIMLSLGIVGVFGLANTEKETRAIFVSWILGPSLLFLFLGSEIQWRLLYLIPYNILAAIGVVTLFGLLERAIPISRSRRNLMMVRVVELGFVVLLMLLFLNNAARSMALTATQVVQ